MHDFLYLDSETFSEVPLKRGFMNYVEGAEVMLVSYASGDDDVGLWDITRGEPMPSILKDNVYDENGKRRFHGAFPFRLTPFGESGRSVGKDDPA